MKDYNWKLIIALLEGRLKELESLHDKNDPYKYLLEFEITEETLVFARKELVLLK